MPARRRHHHENRLKNTYRTRKALHPRKTETPKVPGVGLTWQRRATALLGAEFAVPDLAIMLGRGVADLIPAKDEACATGVLAESGHGLGFRHSLIRAALYDEMPAPVRAAWHRDAGRALVAAGASADRVARQLLRATGGPDARPSRWTSGCSTGWPRPLIRLVGQAPGVWRPNSSSGRDQFPDRFGPA